MTRPFQQTMCVWLLWITAFAVLGLKNIALKKPAAMESEGVSTRSMSAANAVDGNKDTFLHTDSNHDAPWWMVCLLDMYFIHNMTVLPGDAVGLDLFSNWLTNFTITTATKINDQNDLLDEEVRFHSESDLPSGRTHHLNLQEGKAARFLKIQSFHANRRGPLVLCEVEVYGLKVDSESPYGDMENIAVGKKTDQISTVLNGIASKSTDGNWDGEWNHGSCSHTEKSHHPWFIIDLGGPALISTIAMASKGNGCCGMWMLGLTLEVGMRRSEDNDMVGVTQCLYSAGPGYNGQTYIGMCPIGTIGQYIRVQSHHREPLPLLLCEVGVFGTMLAPKTELQRQAVLTFKRNTPPNNWQYLVCSLMCLADDKCVALTVQQDLCSCTRMLHVEMNAAIIPLYRNYFYK